MSESTISDAKFFRMFYIMIAAMVALTVLLAVIAWIIGGASDAQRSRSRQADNKTTLTERVAPFGSMNVASPGAAVAAAASAGGAAAAPAAVDGKATYDSACAACHTTGVAGAPKLGDAAGWKERIAQGKDALYQHALNGFQGKAGMMPAKGGNPALSEAAVKAAVDHILAGSQ